MLEGDFLDEVEHKEPERTPFLSLLCILTWLGSWFMAMYCMIWIFRNRQVEDTQFYYFDTPEEYTLIKVGFFCSLISAFGAYFIWQLKRFGIFIYLAGQIPFGIFGLVVYFFIKPIVIPDTFYFMALFFGQLLFGIFYFLNWNIINSKR